MKQYKESLFIFRRDLRLNDNTALIEAFKTSDAVHICFIADPRQTSDKNPYRSQNAIQFLVESLNDLHEDVRGQGGVLNFFTGEAQNVLRTILTEQKIDAVFVNRDYTPFAYKRDEALEAVCAEENVDFHAFDDTLLHAPHTLLKDNGKPYTVFTPFYKKGLSLSVAEPADLPTVTLVSKMLKKAEKTAGAVLPVEENEQLAVHGGRTAALGILKRIPDFHHYTKTRNDPALNATTHLSAYHKFGCVSARETYSAVTQSLGVEHALIRELYWRDFFTHIAVHFPHVFGQSFHSKYDKLRWKTDKKQFAAWCKGETGFPIVDAGMRELHTTGFMHNRVRMVTASFLVKDLHIDWRWGERYFATQLVDYDPCVNNGSWQWSASTGCDAQPYFRIFNPWLQQKRYDPECQYIKRWMLELRELEPKHIHNWYKQQDGFTAYPAPIVDHSQEAQVAKEVYKQC